MQTQIAPAPRPPADPKQRKRPALLNGMPAPLRGLIRPMLYASVGLHAFLLFVPLNSTGDQPKVPKDQAVKVTQLPPTTKGGASKAKSNIKPVPVRKTSLPLRPLARTSTSTIPPESKKVEAEAQPSAADTAQKKADPNPTQGLEPGSTPGTPTNDPLADFPRYPGAIPGSGGTLGSGYDKSSFQTVDDVSAVMNFYQNELTKKKFDFQPVSDQGGLKVLRVSKDGSSPQYLHLISRAGSGTVMLLAPQEIPSSALKDSKVITEAPEGRELDDLLANGLAAQVSLINVDPSNLANAQLFTYNVDGYKAEIGDAYNPDTSPIAVPEFEALLNGLLSGNGFTLTNAGSYGGGTLYEAKKNSYTGYVSLVPTSAGSTAVYTWTKNPNS
jgi:hypothetical protein